MKYLLGLMLISLPVSAGTSEIRQKWYDAVQKGNVVCKEENPKDFCDCITKNSREAFDDDMLTQIDAGNQEASMLAVITMRMIVSACAAEYQEKNPGK